MSGKALLDYPVSFWGDPDVDWDEFVEFEPQSLAYLSSDADSGIQSSIDQRRPTSPNISISHVFSEKSSVIRSGLHLPSSSSTSASGSLKSAKRKIDEFMLTFPTAEGRSQQRSKRQAFSPERRYQVAKTRKIRACQRCKMRKLSCESSGSCEHCINSVGSTIIGEHICIRHTLEELRFRTADLLLECHDRQAVKSFLKLENPVSRTIHLRFRSYDTGVPLRLEIYDCSQNPQDDDEVVSYSLNAKSPDDPRIPQFSKLATPKYAILDQSLPTPQQLEEWIEQQVDPTEHVWSPSAMLFSSLRSLLGVYLNTGADLPLQGIVKAALRAMNLYECWRNILIVQGQESPENMWYLAKTAGIQIAIVAKRGITECEMVILSELDALIQKSKRPSKEEEFPIWAAVWTLMLLYRDILRRYRHMSHSDYYQRGHFDTAIGLARHMYHALTSTYNHLFRNRNPLSIDWHKAEHFMRLGRSIDGTHMSRMWILLDLMKDRTRCFLESYKYDEDDSIMRALIMEEKCPLALPTQPAKVSTGTHQERSFNVGRHVRHGRGLSNGLYCQCWQ